MTTAKILWKTMPKTENSSECSGSEEKQSTITTENNSEEETDPWTALIDDAASKVRTQYDDILNSLLMKGCDECEAKWVGWCLRGQFTLNESVEKKPSTIRPWRLGMIMWTTIMKPSYSRTFLRVLVSIESLFLFGLVWCATHSFTRMPSWISVRNPQSQKRRSQQGSCILLLWSGRHMQILWVGAWGTL